MSPFEKAPEFIELDNRRFRARNPVSLEHMHHKHEVLFPRSLVEGKTVLDLGAGISATGHWALQLGATHYTGVEIQTEYFKTAQALLEKHHSGAYTLYQENLEAYLDSHTETFDIVALLGSLHSCTDYFSVLRQVCSVSKRYVVIEELIPRVMRDAPYFSGVEFSETETMNLASEHASVVGSGVRISPEGLIFIMRELGFGAHKRLFPHPIQNVDMYNGARPMRYLVRFERAPGAHSLSHSLASVKKDSVRPWDV